MSAKRFIALTLAIVMVFALLAGCTKTEGETTTAAGSNSEGTTAASGEENIRTDIVIGATADVVSPDPHAQNDTSSSKVIHMMFDYLVALNGEGEFDPMLAESWEQEDDLTWVFHLREGVKFHNGEEMTASDVKYSLERCAESAIAKQAVEAIETIEVVDDYTVKLITSYPFAPLLSKLASSKCAIVPEEYTKECDAESDTAFQEAPVGTGPFKFDSWTPNNEFKVVRNDDYWAGTPKCTSIVCRVIPEATSLTIALETGEVDMVESVIAVDAERVKTNEDLKTMELVQGAVTYLGMNYAKEPYNNTDLRKAIAYAIDREAIIEVVLEGYGEILNTVFPPMMAAYDDTIEGYPYDVEKAKEYLAKAGYPDGGLTVEIATSGDERNRIAQLIQANLADIGITVDIALLEWGAYLDYVAGQDHQMFILGWSNAYDPDGNMYDVFHKDRPSTTNRSNFRNDEVSALIDQARTELDWTKREEMYKQLQQMIMDEPVWVPLFAKTAIVGMNKGLEGVVFEPITEFTYNNAYVAE